MTDKDHTDNTRDDKLKQLLTELDLPLASIREHRDYFEQAATGDIDGLSEDAPGVARFSLALADGEIPRPADIDAVDKYGERGEDGGFIKRKLAAADGASRRLSDTPAERLWSFVSRHVSQVDIKRADIAAPRRGEE